MILPTTFPPENASLEELVQFYFNRSYSYDEIMGFLLFVHNVFIGKKTLYRIIKRLKLRRNGVESSLQDIVHTILQLRSKGYVNLGYRSLWKLLNNVCGIRATQTTTRLALQVLDQDGVQARLRRRLVRRQYGSKGPCHCVHIDGYDKLKPYGFSIHGCVDGFSRKILWLTVSHTNKNPRVVARNFIDYLKNTKRVPRMVRSDAGTENVMIQRIQAALRFFHNDEMAGLKSFSVGRSTANQRIEMMWSFLMRYCTEFWRSFFREMIDENILNNNDIIHIECLRFCFFPLIQENLSSFMQMWNMHRIRSQRGHQLCYGIPDVMFYQPVLFGKTDCSFQLPCNERVLNDISEIYTDEPLDRGTSEEFRHVIQLLTNIPIADFDGIPSNPFDAKRLFVALITAIDQYM